MMKSFYLTFDGAPNPPGTDNILAKLDTHDCVATFFMEGHRVAAAADCAARVVAAGHEVGNHSYTHQEFYNLSVDEVRAELQQTDDILEKKLGVCSHFCRPPFGTMTPEIEQAILDWGYTIVLWSYSNRDWETPDVEVLAGRVMDGLRDQAIIVMHDHVPWVPKTLDLIIPAIRSQGYEFKRISEYGQSGILR
jgi:peptidoglycan/xylan/chitin deacetylase (PgdA/CDA1 family)